ncbi:SDR family NAD(P)-dependent oxidoreductase [Aliikangiella maris]
MAGQFPQADNLTEFWENIASGKNCIQDITTNRWDLSTLYQAGSTAPTGKTNSKWMGALADYDCFDPLFFNISPVEAEHMDPQQRLFLQNCWHAIEDAGYDPFDFDHQLCGVFVGCASGDYRLLDRELQISSYGFTGDAASILAARIAYFLNLQGPCLSIDTACSSSLVAIANACDSLNSQSSDVALAGGVYVMSTPDMLIKTAQSGMLSQDGRCFTFDQRANGFVPGEAVGVVLLKRLADAVEAQDNIYGVIQGWGVNQDGKTNGITAPNAESQTRLIEHIYQRFAIDVNQIQLIEAHGTGTKLGDPIEIEGLKEAFKSSAKAQQYCALGSVKSNIGHCLTAAGIAGFIKLMLALKHRQLPPSINFEKLNEHIQLDSTPFYINQQLQPWEVKADQQRMAAISSFGFSGTNAHLVVAEPLKTNATLLNQKLVDGYPATKVLMPLSARTSPQLLQKIEQLTQYLNMLETDSKNDNLLINLALSLQITRSAMEERVCWLVESFDELQCGLAQVAEALNQNSTEPQLSTKNIFYANTKRSRQLLRARAESVEQQQALAKQLLDDQSWHLLAELWTMGGVFDWREIYLTQQQKSNDPSSLKNITLEDLNVQRLQLPLYPFAKERYWVQPNCSQPGVKFEAAHQAEHFSSISTTHLQQLHPLVHRNCSTVFQPVFEATFSGHENFLKDHQVAGNKVMPGVAYLEMIRAATCAALGVAAQTPLVLEKIVWVTPFVFIDSEQTMRVLLQVIDEEQLTFVVESQRTNEAAQQHCQGRIKLNPLMNDEDLKSAEADYSKVDIHALIQQINDTAYSADVCYAHFAHIGLNYGKSHRTLVKLNRCLLNVSQLQNAKQDQTVQKEYLVLAELKLDAEFHQQQKQFVLYPGLLDAAIQASVGLYDELPEQAALPFGLDNLTIYREVGEHCWAVIQLADNVSQSSQVQKLNIALYNQHGQLSCVLEGLNCRKMSSNIQEKSVTHAEETLLAHSADCYFTSTWQSLSQATQSALSAESKQIVLTAGLTSLTQLLNEQSAPHVIVISIDENDTWDTSFTAESEFDTAFTSCFIEICSQLLATIQSLIKQYPAKPIQLQLVMPGHWHSIVEALVAGLKSVEKEYGRISVQLVLLDRNANAQQQIVQLATASCYAENKLIRFDRLQPEVFQYQAITLPQYVDRKSNQLSSLNSSSASQFSSRSLSINYSPIKQNGVYLITGGAGGIGRLLIEMLANISLNITIVLVGRSAEVNLNDITSKLSDESGRSHLPPNQIKLVYRSVDVTNEQAVAELVKWIAQKYGQLHGVFHAAGLNQDNFIRNKSAQELQHVLAPKVAGTLLLMKALTQPQISLSLDFMVLFSSIAACSGNAGQFDYAIANSVMDKLALAHMSLLSAKKQSSRASALGKIISINWPLWDDGGMQVSDADKQQMTQQSGLQVLNAQKATQVLLQCLQSDYAQVVVTQGNPQKIYHLLGVTEAQTACENISLDKNHFEKTPVEKNAKTIEPITQAKEDRVIAKAYSQNQAIAQAVIKPVTDNNKQRNASVNTSNTNDEWLIEQLQQALLKLIAEQLKIKIDVLDCETELSDYGLDSIGFTEFANRVNSTYDMGVTPTVFFEFPTIETFAEYLLTEYRVQLVKQFGGQSEHPIGERQAVSTEMHIDVQPEKIVHTTESSGAGSAQSMIKIPLPWMRKNHAKMNTELSTLTDNQVQQNISQPSHTTAASLASAVAIIGVSARFPQARNLAEFWQNLFLGKDCISEIPSDRWLWQELYGDPKTQPNKTNIKWGGFIDGVDQFDPLFFGITPREAQLIDPQQRLMMTYVWQVIEDAGYASESLSGTNTGIFIGTTTSGYGDLLNQAGVAIEGYSSTGMVPSVGPNRISYLLNLHGPSEPVETACSSSLVAIHRAIQAITADNCNMAIAGGVNIIITPWAHIAFSKAGMLCEDGRCKTFSSDANGYVRGEGIGMLLLKRLTDAQQDGDAIYGVIRASAENHGGKANTLTSPNPKAQAELIYQAYHKAQIDPRTVTYIEAHGTGTELGDPVEINGLKAAFSRLQQTYSNSTSVDEHYYCGIGSVKSNIGHLELSAGVAGVIKVLLQFKQAMRVKSLHSEKINPYIQLQNTPFYIVQQNENWSRLTDESGQIIPRRAGVSSFGFGGANAHVLLEEYIAPPANNLVQKENHVQQKSFAQDKMVGAQSVIIPLSAKTPQSLQQMVRQLFEFLQKQLTLTEAMTDAATETATDTNDKFKADLKCDNLTLQNLAYTLQVGRDAMQERVAWVVDSFDALIEALNTFLIEGTEAQSVYSGRVRNNKSDISELTADEDWQLTVQNWLAKKKYHKLAALWVKGGNIQWQQLYPQGPLQRLHLPTYAFDNSRIWFEVDSLAQNSVSYGGLYHPPQSDELNSQANPVWENISDFYRHAYQVRVQPNRFTEKLLTNQERYLHESVILQWVIATFSDAIKSTQSAVSLSQVVFLNTISCDEARVIELVFKVSDSSIENSFEFKVISRTEIAESSIVYCQGIIAQNIGRVSQSVNLDIAPVAEQLAGQNIGYPQALNDSMANSSATPNNIKILNVIQTEQMIAANIQLLTTNATDCFNQDIQVDMTLARSNKDCLSQQGFSQASLLNRLLLSLFELTAKLVNESVTDIYAFDELNWQCDTYHMLESSQQMTPQTNLDQWLVVVEEQPATSSKEKTFLALVYNNHQQLCLSVKGIGISAPMNTTLEGLLNQKTGKSWVVLNESWQLQPLDAHQQDWYHKIHTQPSQDIVIISDQVSDYDNFKSICQQLLTIADLPASHWSITGVQFNQLNQLEKLLKQSQQPVTLFILLPDDISKMQTLTSAAKNEYSKDKVESQTDDPINIENKQQVIYECLQQTISNASQRQLTLYCFYTNHGVLYAQEQLAYQALSGLFKSAMLECPNHCYQTLSMTATKDRQSIARKLLEEWLHNSVEQTGESHSANLSAMRVPMIQYIEQQRYVLQLNELTDYQSGTQVIGFKKQATYLMVGALGDVGQLICHQLATHYQARLVILSSRSAEVVADKLAAIESLGSQVIYHQVDILDESALLAIKQKLAQQNIVIQGVIHMARRVKDALIIHKSFTEFNQIMAAKVQGTINIDKMMADQPLDFFMIYSSMAAFGIKGSADYAYSTAFQNAFVNYRQQLVKQQQRRGRSLAICWGQWEVDGAVNQAQLNLRTQQLEQMGMSVIDAQSAMHLMDASLNGVADVVGYIAASDRNKVKALLNFQDVSQSLSSSSASVLNNESSTINIDLLVQEFTTGKIDKTDFIAQISAIPEDSISDSALSQIVQAIQIWDEKQSLYDKKSLDNQPPFKPLTIAPDNANSGQAGLKYNRVKPAKSKPYTTDYSVSKKEGAAATQHHFAEQSASVVAETNAQNRLESIATKSKSVDTDSSQVDQIKSTLSEAMQTILKINAAAIDVDKTFQEYGLDSITAVQLTTALEKQFNVNIAPNWLIDYSTINLLAKKLSQVCA